MFFTVYSPLAISYESVSDILIFLGSRSLLLANLSVACQGKRSIHTCILVSITIPLMLLIEYIDYIEL